MAEPSKKVKIIHSIRQVEADFRHWLNRPIFPCVSRDELIVDGDSIKEHFAAQLKSLTSSARGLRLLGYSQHGELLEKAHSKIVKELDALHGYPGSGELKAEVVKEFVEILHDVAQSVEDGPGTTDSKHQSWSDNAPEYGECSVLLKFAEFMNRRLSPSQLSKALEPTGKVRYMRKRTPFRCKAHVGDFMEYIKSLPLLKPDGNAPELTDEAIDEYLADAEATRAEIKEQKRLKGK